ncbi:MAG: fasciclin domain-containing protein [Bacteroidaceae bacterium]|nr:fasciclin domain-containing protein [Bacteroidaceae bacterium]
MKIKFFAAVVALLTALQLGFVSCSDDPGADSYYTSTSEYASDYLKNREEYSMYLEILARATGTDSTKNLRLVDLLGTYGSYTVFAPTNDAVKVLLASKGKSTVAELTKEDCDTIALNSIIEQAYFTSDVSDGTYPKSNMLDQYLTITCDSDVTSGSVELVMYINSDAKIIHADDSVSNGVVHTVNKVVLSNTDFLSDFLGRDDNIKLYYEALKVTHLSDSLTKYIDENYSVGDDSIDWTNDALVFSTATEYDNVAYMEHRYFKYTAFVCPDSVLEQKYGITSLEDLDKKAHELYDPMYPNDANITDYTNRRNALNRFISYHFLDRYGSYYTLTCVDGANSTLAKNWNRLKWDIADWYETMMPNSILKCSFPSGTQNGLYINRRGVMSRADERGVFIPGAKVTPASEMGVTQTCVNGIYHYISDIISYNETTQKEVLNERMRIDASTLSPDFMTSEARGHYTKSSYENGKYGTWDATANRNNKNTCLGFKPGAAKNFTFDSNTHLHVRPRVLSFWSYQGDEVTILGVFNFTVKLPPVPKGTYELRLFTCVNFSNRGIIQVYIDDEPQGIPFDMRPDGTTLFGWQSDTSLGDEDAIAAFDKSIHNLGWMKGPKSYYSASSESGGTRGTCFRDASNTIRKVLGTFVSDGETEHYVRFQQKLESTTNAMNFDFIEIVPSSVYDDDNYPEDRW